MTARVGNITFHAKDPFALAEFWSAVMGYPFSPDYPEEFERMLREGGATDDDLNARCVAWDDDPTHQRFFFHRYDHEKRQRNRIHLDIDMFDDRRATREELQGERDRLIALGATLEKEDERDWGPFREYVIMLRDPEGNEFCLH